MRVLEGQELIAQRLMVVDAPSLDAQSGLRELDSLLSSSSLLESATEEDPIIKQFAFESDLESSRVYQRSNWRDGRTFSVNTTSVLTTGRSLLSGLSLGDVSNISVVAIPIYAEDITNKLIYQFDSHDKFQAQDRLEASEPQSQSSRRKTLLASLEYTIEDWNITIKTGYHGVLAQLIARIVDHQDLILVIPCIGAVEYPLEKPAEPLSVLMFGGFYSLSVYYHAFQNITYVLLDCPVFRERSKNEPFPEGIDEDTSAKLANSVESLSFYSAWNQCIAQIITRFSPDLYWITDLRGTLAPWYIRHHSIPCIFLFHDEGDFVYRQLGSTSDWSMIEYLLNLDMGAIISNDGSDRPKPLGFFDLLFLAALYLGTYQAGQGFINSGIESTYDKKSHTHKTISQAGINHINHLCFPDPSDIAAKLRPGNCNIYTAAILIEYTRSQSSRRCLHSSLRGPNLASCLPALSQLGLLL